jgi:hypothetical protein
MFQHDWILWQLAQERRRDLMRELEHDRLVRQAELATHPHQHTLYHVSDWIGRQLVRWGERLQARHAVVHRQALTHPTGG